MPNPNFSPSARIWRQSLLLASTALVFAGCATTQAQAPTRAKPAFANQQQVPAYPQLQQPAGQSAEALPYAAADYAQVQPAAGYAPAPYAGMAGHMQGLGSLQADLMKSNERLERIERALLRLDRRMQLVERNELGRMGGAQTSSADGTMPATGMAPAMADGMQVPNYGPDFQPVNQTITSALQAAPAAGQGGGAYQAISAPATTGGAGGLPSLADTAPAAGRMPAGQGADLAIWTVRFANAKIWPDRTELPASRDVVQALLQSNNSGQGLTLFARGNKPTSVVFRDRVKALSRYLAKVSSRDTVAIATLPAPHLDEDTIEIFATQ